MSEFELIDKLNLVLGHAFSQSDIGPGDDAAVISGIENGQLLVSKDLLVEGVHFDLSYCSLQDVGWKALAVNESDIFAMGGEPVAFLIGLALPLSKQEDPALIYEGMREYLRSSQAKIYGGDLTKSDKLVVSVTVIGKSKNPITRSGAKIGDAIYLSGALGFSAIGLDVLTGRNNYRLTEDQIALAISMHKRPVPQNLLSRDLVGCKSLTSMIDISDGLFQDLSHVAKSSEVSLEINFSEVQVAFNCALLEDRIRLVTSGEDYALAFTMSTTEDFRLIKEKFPDAIQIGVVIEKGDSLVYLSNDGAPRTRISLEDFLIKSGFINQQLGFDHFS